jgi:hypothetical protein
MNEHFREIYSLRLESIMLQFGQLCKSKFY